MTLFLLLFISATNNWNKVANHFAEKTFMLLFSHLIYFTPVIHFATLHIYLEYDLRISTDGLKHTNQIIPFKKKKANQNGCLNTERSTSTESHYVTVNFYQISLLIQTLITDAAICTAYRISYTVVQVSFWTVVKIELRCQFWTSIDSESYCAMRLINILANFLGNLADSLKCSEYKCSTAEYRAWNIEGPYYVKFIFKKTIECSLMVGKVHGFCFRFNACFGLLF